MSDAADSIPGHLDAIRARVGQVERELRSMSEAVPRQIEEIRRRLESEEGARMQLARTLDDVASRQRSIELQLSENTVLTRIAATTAEASAKRVDDAVTKIGVGVDTLMALHNGRIWLGVSRKLGIGIVALAASVLTVWSFWDKVAALIN